MSEASAALQVRQGALERQATEARCRLALAAQDASQGRLGLEYEIARMDAERVWVSGLIDEIEAGRLTDSGSGPSRPDH